MEYNTKSSGIDWLSDILAQWKISKIKYKAKINPPSYPRGLNKDAEVTFLPMEYIHNGYYEQNTAYLEDLNASYNTFNNDDLIIAKVTPCFENGNIAIVKNLINDFGFGTSEIFVIRVDKSFSNTYLMYLLQNSAFIEQAVFSMTGVAGLKRIPSSFVENYTFGSPPLFEQNAIAAFLDEKCGIINSIIKDINEQIDILNQYKKAVITETITKGLDKNAPMKESGIEWIGKIPLDFEFVKLKYLLPKNKVSIRVGPFGSELTGNDYVLEGKWVYTQRVVLDNEFRENDTFISDLKYKKMRDFSVEVNDILITTRGTIGKIARVPKGFNEGILHPCLIKFCLDDNLIEYDLIEFVFNNTDFLRNQLAWYSNATTIEVIYSTTLRIIYLPLIPMKKQQEIIKYLRKKCAEIDKLISKKQESIRIMQEYKKAIIYEYTTGKKCVKGFA